MTTLTDKGIGLNDHQLSSDVWQLVEIYCEARLAELRAQNDVSRSLEVTEKLRGRIAEIKQFQRAGRPPARGEEAAAE